MVDVALYEAVFNMMESLIPDYDLLGEIRGRIGTGLTNIVPSNTYTTRDGQQRGHRRQRRQHLQAADARDRARRSRPGSRRSPTTSAAVKRTAAIDGAIGEWAAAHDLDDILRSAQGGRRAAWQDLHRRRHRRAIRSTWRAT